MSVPPVRVSWYPESLIGPSEQARRQNERGRPVNRRRGNYTAVLARRLALSPRARVAANALGNVFHYPV